MIEPTTGGTVNGNGSLLLTGMGENILSADVLANSEIDLYVLADDIPAVDTLTAYMPGPSETLSENLIKWLHQGITSGTFEQVEMVLKGKLKDFPFTKPNITPPGEFQVNAKVRDVNLRFHQDWLPINVIEGQVVFRGDEFYSIIQQGNIGGAKVVEAVVVIPELKRQGAVVNVTGTVEGTAQEAVAYLKAAQCGSACNLN